MSKSFITIITIATSICLLSTITYAQNTPDLEALKKIQTFTIEPSDPNKISSWKIIAEVKPGETYNDSVILKNTTDNTVELFNLIVDSYVDENGEQKYTNYIKEQEFIGKWGTIEESTILEPDEEKTVNFQIVIPKDAELKTYYSAITTKLRGEIEGSIRKTYRIMTPLELTVTDDPQPIPKYSDDIQANLLAPTPFFWGTVALFFSSMGYLVYSRRKEKKDKQNK